jgi:geranylgeranyl diphosphate synthase type I
MLTGDALFTLAMRLLVAEGENLEPIRCLVDACLDIAAGQALDLAYECTALEDVSLEGYMEMAGGKTGALYACALSIGGELAGASRVVIDTLRKAGHELGMVAQEVDDINGTWGDPSVCGKPVLSDLMRRKKSLPVVAMLHRAEDGVRSRFLELWSAEERTDANAQEMLSLLNAACAAEFCQEQAEQHYRRALVYLDGLDMPGPVRIELADLAYFIRHRRS